MLRLSIIGGLVAFILAGSPSPVAAQEAPPLVVDAERVVFDDIAQTVEATGHASVAYRGVQVKADVVRMLLRDERLEASGNVVIIDTTGREMRGEKLTYDAREQVVEISPAEALIDGVYIRSDRMRARPGLIVAGESMLTTCDPAHPAYRVTATRIEVIPGERAVAHEATLWVGRHWIFSLPLFTVSLRSPEETAGSFPSFGYDHIDGLWFSYRYGFFVGVPLAYVSTTLGTLGQLAEVGVLLPERPLGIVPVSLNAAASAGWHHETGLNIETTRLQYSVGLESVPVRFGPDTDWQTTWTWTDAVYGTGDRQGITRLLSVITHHLDAKTTLSLGYNALRVYGATPLEVDAVDPDDLVDKLRLMYEKTGVLGGVIVTTLRAGGFYDYMTGTTSVTAAYGERISTQYHWEVGPEYNLDTQVTTLVSDTGVSVGADTYFTVQGRYNTATTLFEDLDYIVTARIADCFDLSVKYRQVRQELWISVALGVSPLGQTDQGVE